MKGVEWDTIPEGFEGDAFFERVLSAQYCTYDKLADGTLSIQDVFDMHSKLDLRDYMSIKARERAQKEAKASNGRH